MHLELGHAHPYSTQWLTVLLSTCGLIELINCRDFSSNISDLSFIFHTLGMLLNYGSVSSGLIVFLQAEWEDTAPG